MEVQNLLQILRAVRRETRAIRKKKHYKKFSEDLQENLDNHIKKAEEQILKAIKNLDELALAEDLDHIERRDKKGEQRCQT